MRSRIITLLRVLHRPGRRVARQAHRFSRGEDGATVIEFGLVIFPFLAILFAIIETAFVFFAGQVFETAVADSSRMIMTGQVQTQGFDQAKFKTEICSRLEALINCEAGVQIDVKKYDSFGEGDTSLPLDDEGNLDTSKFGYQPGKQGDIIVVRAVYEWPLFMRTFGFDLSNLPNGKRLLMASAAFRNEPYVNQSPPSP